MVGFIATVGNRKKKKHHAIMSLLGALTYNAYLYHTYRYTWYMAVYNAYAYWYVHVQYTSPL